MANNRTQYKDSSIKDKEQPLDIGANSGDTDEFMAEAQNIDTGNVQTDEDELRQDRADSDKDADSRGGRR